MRVATVCKVASSQPVGRVVKLSPELDIQQGEVITFCHKVPFPHQFTFFFKFFWSEDHAWDTQHANTQ